MVDRRSRDGGPRGVRGRAHGHRVPVRPVARLSRRAPRAPLAGAMFVEQSGRAAVTPLADRASRGCVAGDPYGLGRVIGEPGVLPQRAGGWIASLPIRSDEMLIDVESLNVDAASFKQIRESCGGSAGGGGRAHPGDRPQPGKDAEPGDRLGRHAAGPGPRGRARAPGARQGTARRAHRDAGQPLAHPAGHRRGPRRPDGGGPGRRARPRHPLRQRDLGAGAGRHAGDAGARRARRVWRAGAGGAPRPAGDADRGARGREERRAVPRAGAAEHRREGPAPRARHLGEGALRPGRAGRVGREPPGGCDQGAWTCSRRSATPPAVRSATW